jgi:hypothetical protein
MLWAGSMVLMVGGGVLGYLVTGSPWSFAIGGLLLAIVLRIMVAMTVDGRRGRWGPPGPHDVVPGRRTRRR